VGELSSIITNCGSDLPKIARGYMLREFSLRR
jgi:hypothetical protein